MLLLRDFGRSLIHWGGLNDPFSIFIGPMCPRWPHSSPGWDSEREQCVLTKEDMSSSMIGRMQRRLTTMRWRGRAASSTYMRTTCPPSPFKFRYMVTIIIVAQNDPIHHQAGILGSFHRHKTNRYPPQRFAIKVQYKEFCHISREGGFSLGDTKLPVPSWRVGCKRPVSSFVTFWGGGGDPQGVFWESTGFWAGALCSQQGGHVLNLHHPRHHGSDPTQRSHSIPISIPF